MCSQTWNQLLYFVLCRKAILRYAAVNHAEKDISQPYQYIERHHLNQILSTFKIRWVGFCCKRNLKGYIFHPYISKLYEIDKKTSTRYYCLKLFSKQIRDKINDEYDYNYEWEFLRFFSINRLALTITAKEVYGKEIYISITMFYKWKDWM